MRRISRISRHSWSLKDRLLLPKSVRWRALIVLLVVEVAGCAHISRLERVCGSSPNDAVCLGEMIVPQAKADDFEQGAKAAVDALYSDRFRNDLVSFIREHAASSDREGAWKGHDADEIIIALRKEIVGTQVSTFGGPKGLWYYTVYGTVAFERATDDSPVRMNRWGLGSRTSAEIANTIVHEVAHAAGLTHPHMGGPAPKDSTISACEPPYLLGSLAERIAAGDQWKWTAYHCSYLR